MFLFPKACLYLIILDSCTGKLAVVNNVIKQQFIYPKVATFKQPFNAIKENERINRTMLLGIIYML